jgi:hypothetical protein
MRVDGTAGEERPAEIVIRRRQVVDRRRCRPSFAAWTMSAMSFLLALAVAGLPAVIVLGLLAVTGLLVASLADAGPDRAGGGLVRRLLVRTT